MANTSRKATAMVGLGGLAGALLLARALLRNRRSRPGSTTSDAGPSQVLPPAPVPREPSGSATTRRFDPLFAKYSRGMPVAFLRALARGESDMKPGDIHPTSNARGLLQVVREVREDFNKRHQTSYSPEDLLDPEINVMIATETLRRIIDSFKRFHPRVPNLQERWDNPRFAELLVLGWNSGYSEVGGLGRVARVLESYGIRDITADLIHGNAAFAGATRHLQEPARLAWSKAVVRRYFRERARDEAERAQRPVA